MPEEKESHWLLSCMERHHDLTALVFRGEAYSYGRLLTLTAQWSERLRRENVFCGACVATVGDYSADSISLMLALLVRKAVWVPLLATIPDEEINVRLKTAGCDFIVDVEKKTIEKRGHGGAHDLVQRLRRSHAAGLVLFSSGSTGKPKAMLQNFDSMVNRRQTTAATRRGARYLALLMFDHIGGINTLITSLARSGVLILAQSRSGEEIGELVSQQRAEVIPLSPSQAALMLAGGIFDRYDFSSVKIITYGAEAMPAPLLERLNKKLPAVKLIQTFGTSETDIAKTQSRDSGSLDIRFVNPEDEYRIVSGELWLRSNRQILGYLNAEMNMFTEDGWFRTGDMVEESGDGWFRIVGRKSDVINVGGQKLLPADVEKVLMADARVADCVVYGEKSALLGQQVAADVQLYRQGAEAVDEAAVKRDLRRACLKELERYKVPARIRVVEKIAISDRAKKKRRR